MDLRVLKALPGMLRPPFCGLALAASPLAAGAPSCALPESCADTKVSKSLLALLSSVSGSCQALPMRYRELIYIEGSRLLLLTDRWGSDKDWSLRASTDADQGRQSAG